jgi:hypothetical protein
VKLNAGAGTGKALAAGAAGSAGAVEGGDVAAGAVVAGSPDAAVDESETVAALPWRYRQQRRPYPQPLVRDLRRIAEYDVGQRVACRPFPSPRPALLVDSGAENHRLGVQVRPFQTPPTRVQLGQCVGDGVLGRVPVAARHVGQRAQ